MEPHNQDELEAMHSEYSNPKVSLDNDFGLPTYGLFLSATQLLLLESILDRQPISVAPLNDLRLKVTKMVELIISG